jgi:hypothetical protein
MYGEQSPSGRLPYTVAKESDYRPLAGPSKSNINLQSTTRILIFNIHNFANHNLKAALRKA